MNKLLLSRIIRSNAENKAVTKIQAIYRGYNTRKNFHIIQQNVTINKNIRNNIKSFLGNRHYMNISLLLYKKKRTRLRNYCAIIIQCLFLQYLSRKTLRRLQYESILSKKLKSATVIQCFVRGIIARARVKLLIERIRIVLAIRSAIKIQTRLRILFARRKIHRRRLRLRLLASRTIQNWYRAKYARRISESIRQALLLRRHTNAAIGMQKVIRKFLAKRRVNRIRYRCLFMKVYKYVTRIQTMIRRFNAKCYVMKLREAKAKEVQRKKFDELRKSREIENKKLAEETEELLNSVNIFLQATKGNTREVEDIFKGLSSADTHLPTDVNEFGDTVLSIASSLGNLPLVRKCLQWGFDINHRNIAGLTPIMLATKNNHYDVVQYIISSSAEASDESPSKLKPFSPEDAAYLIITAASQKRTIENGLLPAFVNYGLDLDIEGEGKNTAVLATCEVGDVECFKYLISKKANLDVINELGQTPLHKASMSSIKIVESLLGLDANYSIFVSEEDRPTYISKCDADGKDCYLHAILSGQNQVVDLYENILSSSGHLSKGSEKTKTTKSEEIGWTPNDIIKAMNLVETGNILCLIKLLEIGFDPNWPLDGTKMTLAMKACSVGDTDVVDVLMNNSADFSLIDNNKQNVLHHAARCKTNSVIATVLTHACASKCKVTSALLIATDSNGDTPMHIAAQEGVEVKIDLLACAEITKALSMKNKAGMTPLLIACSYNYEKLINSYLKLNADVAVVDKKIHSCIWHLLHPHESVAKVTRPMASENKVKIKKEQKDDLAKLNSDITLLLNFLNLGCTLYTRYKTTAKEMLDKPFNQDDLNDNVISDLYESGDVLVRESSITFFKQLFISKLCTIPDCWRLSKFVPVYIIAHCLIQFLYLVISSIRFDDGTCKIFSALLKLGAVDLLTGVSETEERVAVPGKAHTVTQQSVDIKLSNSHIKRLQKLQYLDMNIMAWVIQLRNCNALELILKKGYDITLSVDNLGNSTLHYLALYGTPEMLEVLMTNCKTVKLSILNKDNETPIVLASKAGNSDMMKKLFSYRVSPRSALEGKYWAWVLARARQQESREQNIQTGRVGDDDLTYFSTAPEPNYISWYF